jgi:hypothetical protein
MVFPMDLSAFETIRKNDLIPFASEKCPEYFMQDLIERLEKNHKKIEELQVRL